MKQYVIQFKAVFDPQLDAADLGLKLYNAISEDEYVAYPIGYRVNASNTLYIEFEVTLEDDYESIAQLSDAWALASNVYLDALWALDLSPVEVGLALKEQNKPRLEELQEALDAVNSD